MHFSVLFGYVLSIVGLQLQKCITTAFLSFNLATIQLNYEVYTEKLSPIRLK